MVAGNFKRLVIMALVAFSLGFLTPCAKAASETCDADMSPCSTASVNGVLRIRVAEFIPVPSASGGALPVVRQISASGEPEYHCFVPDYQASAESLTWTEIFHGASKLKINVSNGALVLYRTIQSVSAEVLNKLRSGTEKGPKFVEVFKDPCEPQHGCKSCTKMECEIRWPTIGRAHAARESLTMPDYAACFSLQNSATKGWKGLVHRSEVSVQGYMIVASDKIWITTLQGICAFFLISGISFLVLA